MTAGFETAWRDLPEEIPVFPLPRVILLPRVQLPLNIFEPRYLAMTLSALSSDRLIGMIQPGVNTGCAGRIVSFSETEDGRYLVTLRGVCRFNVREEKPQDAKGFRRIAADWSPYAADLSEDKTSDICIEPVLETLRAYFDMKGMLCDKWEEMYEISCERLLSTLCVVCPLEAEEKQALLEAMTLSDRARILQCLLENAIKSGPNAAKPCCH